MERYVIFNLRRSSRVDDDLFRDRFDSSLSDIFADEIKFLMSNGTLEQDATGIGLTELGALWRYNVLNVFYDSRFISQ